MHSEGGFLLWSRSLEQWLPGPLRAARGQPGQRDGHEPQQPGSTSRQPRVSPRGLPKATEQILSNSKSVGPQRRQRPRADLHQVKMGLEEYKIAAVTLEFGLGNLERIIVEVGSISFCLLFQGDFLFHVKSGNDHC